MLQIYIGQKQSCRKRRFGKEPLSRGPGFRNLVPRFLDFCNSGQNWAGKDFGWLVWRTFGRYYDNELFTGECYSSISLSLQVPYVVCSQQ
jgi:hypothetical protein